MKICRFLAQVVDYLNKKVYNGKQERYIMNSDFVYEFYSEGFFGYSQTKDFYYFSFWHFLPLSCW